MYVCVRGRERERRRIGSTHTTTMHREEKEERTVDVVGGPASRPHSFEKNRVKLQTKRGGTAKRRGEERRRDKAKRRERRCRILTNSGGDTVEVRKREMVRGRSKGRGKERFGGKRLRFSDV